MKIKRMKKIVTIMLLACSAQCVSAQTWSEWFRQKKTQKKYLLQQIAALQVYASYAAKGYTIAKDGLGIIGNIRKGDFSMHSNYFTSLVTVNPQAKKYQKVAAIMSMQVTIAKQAGNTFRQLRANKQFTPAEINYLKSVFGHLLEGCSETLDELYNLVTNGNLQMKDDQRLKAIDRMYTDMQDKQTFLRSFTDEAEGLSMQRDDEAKNIIILKNLNGLQ